jgi:exopolyphosphatase/guanosine-5'-triphosphate,3'-diphosphate pyrophosphatase
MLHLCHIQVNSAQAQVFDAGFPLSSGLMSRDHVPNRKKMPTGAGADLVGVLDMGASAIRLAIAEIKRGQPPRIIEEMHRGVLLGRDTFSTGAISAKTIDAVLAALDGFRKSFDLYGVRRVRAVATSAVREARNGDLFLDRIRRRTAITFEVINEAEEGRLLFLAVRSVLAHHPSIHRGSRALIAEVGGGSTTIMLLRRGNPIRSGAYALGSVRIRQQLNVARQSHDVQVALLRRYIANIVEEIRGEVPLERVTHFIAVGGDIRFAASQILDSEAHGGVREIERQQFLSFCDEVTRLEEEAFAERFRLAPGEADTFAPALLIYSTLLAETSARRLVVCDATMRAGMLLDFAHPGSRASALEFERQVLASAESLGQRYHIDLDHGRHVARLSVRLFDELRDEHGLADRHRLLLQVAALLHDIGVYVSLRAHHKHAQYILSASQIFGLSNDETAIVANIARYHRRAIPQDTHLPYVALDREDRLAVDKLGAILRVANALDAEHGQKVRDLHLVRDEGTWRLVLEGTGDLTMERLAANARADLFIQTFGRQLVTTGGAV